MALGARSPTTLARSPERRGEVRRRKRRRRRSEQRLSDARKILEERNAGLGPRHRDRLTLKRAAEEVGLTMRHPEQILSRHVRRRIAETTQNETPTPMGVHGAADVIEANPTNLDSDPTSALRRSGRVGNSSRKPLTELEKSQRENLLSAMVGSSKRSLYGKIVAETTQKISQAEFGAKRAIAREEIEKANESLGLKLPSEKHLVRLAHETPKTRRRCRKVARC